MDLKAVRAFLQDGHLIGHVFFQGLIVVVLAAVKFVLELLEPQGPDRNADIHQGKAFFHERNIEAPGTQFSDQDILFMDGVGFIQLIGQERIDVINHVAHVEDFNGEFGFAEDGVDEDVAIEGIVDGGRGDDADFGGGVFGDDFLIIIEDAYCLVDDLLGDPALVKGVLADIDQILQGLDDLDLPALILANDQFDGTGSYVNDSGPHDAYLIDGL